MNFVFEKKMNGIAKSKARSTKCRSGEDRFSLNEKQDIFDGASIECQIKSWELYGASHAPVSINKDVTYTATAVAECCWSV